MKRAFPQWNFAILVATIAGFVFMISGVSSILTSQVLSSPTILDNTNTKSFITSGKSWRLASFKGTYNGSARYSLLSNLVTAGSTEIPAAQWQYTLPPGDYMFQLSWAPKKQLFNAVRYSIFDGSDIIASGFLNQQQVPSGDTANGVFWHTLKASGDRTRLPVTNGAVIVLLQGPAVKPEKYVASTHGYYIMADALRIVPQSSAPNPNCGNGKMEDGEQCDAGGSNGVVCTAEPGQTSCRFCDTQCKYATENAASRCGDGILHKELLEECDDGNSYDKDSCPNTCKKPVCGDGKIEGYEKCDDGNTADFLPFALPADGLFKQPVYDGCSSRCLPTEASGARCGDGIVQPSLQEECEDMNPNDFDNCSSSCTRPVCGDAKQAGMEECDDGNSLDTDFCSNTCKRPVCGNGQKESNEECDDGNTVNGDSCPSNCLLSYAACQNGVREGVELCDDRNTINTDSCPNDCGVPVCGDGKISKGEKCDYKDPRYFEATYLGTCTKKCTLTYCGDGVVQTRRDPSSNEVIAEGCDDGLNNLSSVAVTLTIDPPYAQTAAEATATISYCSTLCTQGVVRSGYCGDGKVQEKHGEECDDANSMDFDHCSNTCKKERCGDGKKSAYENCDDGNTDENDGCTSKCTQPRCGDMIVSGIEECDDGNADNTDGCSASCKKVAISNSPAPICGNGILEADERCDDGNTVNTVHGPNGWMNDECSTQCLLQEPGRIDGKGRCGDGMVQESLKEECDDANINNLDNCSNRCARSVCGDGKRAGTEECDDGNSTNADFCSNDCKRPVCGNGTKEATEECDDGNTIDGDSCPSNCRITPTTCGNGIREGVERCDDGNVVNTDSCPNDCGIPVCGNGKVDSTEECDPAINYGPYQYCSPYCTLTFCGDGIKQTRYNTAYSGNVDAEACDEGAGNMSVYDAKSSTLLPYSLQRVEVPKCSLSCTPITMFNRYCGDSIVEQEHGEECDDANKTDTDGCTNACKKPFCGDGIKSLTEQCDDGNSNDTDGCTAKCQVMTVVSCGNGIVENYPNEECDDRNTNDNDNCRNNCKLPRCGDGILDDSNPLRYPERCDDGTKNGIRCVPEYGGTCTYCGTQCQPEWVQAGRCGDRIVQTGEECDDGKNGDNMTDSCTDSCKKPTCGDHVKSALEECDDGNSIDNDNCSNSCKRAMCGDGIIQQGEQCDGNFTYCNAPYDGTCQYCSSGGSSPCQFVTVVGPRCGDKNRDWKYGEECDDGNTDNTDNCPTNCKTAVCGDGFVFRNAEQCDDGNRINDYDDCPNSCWR